MDTGSAVGGSLTRPAVIPLKIGPASPTTAQSPARRRPGGRPARGTADRDAVGWIVALAWEQVGPRRGKQVFRAANVDLRSSRQAAAEAGNSSGPPASQNLREHTAKWRGGSASGGKTIKEVDRGPMTDVEIGKAPVSAQIEAVLNNDALVGPRIVIDGFRKRVRGIECEAASESFVRRQPERVVARIAAAFALCDVGQSRVW